MVSQAVSFSAYLPGEFRKPAHPFSDQEESGFDVISAQDLKYFWRERRVWAVVKGYRNHSFRSAISQIKLGNKIRRTRTMACGQQMTRPATPTTAAAVRAIFLLIG